MTGERPDRPGSPPEAAAGDGWSSGALNRVRGLMTMASFEEARELSEQGALRARHDGQNTVWREFTALLGMSLVNSGRFREGLEICDAVVASAEADDDDAMMAEAWNVSAVAADRLGHEDDALRRLDGSLAIGERYLREHSRRDLLFKAASSAGAIGMAELGVAVFSLGVEQVPDAAGSFNPGFLMWIKATQVQVRCHWALALEHEGRSGAAERHEGALALSREAFAGLPDPSMMPAAPAALFRAYEAFSLVALGRSSEAGEALAAASGVLPPEPFEMLTGSVALLVGVIALREAPPAAADELTAVSGRLVDLAARCRDARLETEVWRLTAAAAMVLGDAMMASRAAERFETLVERLDWRRRMRVAKVLGFRSDTMQRMAEGDGWLPSG